MDGENTNGENDDENVEGGDGENEENVAGEESNGESDEENVEGGDGENEEIVENDIDGEGENVNGKGVDGEYLFLRFAEDGEHALVELYTVSDLLLAA